MKASLKIALLASHNLHHGPDSLMVKFIREFETFLFSQKIFVTKGLWENITDCGLLKNHQDVQLLRCKKDGGILECTAMVVDGSLNVVIFLLDPTDMASLFPDRAALKRECVAKNKFFLSTYASAREWATLTWSAPNHFLLADNEVDKVQKLCNTNITTKLSSQTIALIAHDKMKIPIIQFAKKHQKLLNKFAEIIGTGTTATLIKGEKTFGELDKILKGRNIEEKRDLKKAINEVRRLKLRLSKMQRNLSGPQGGDVQIARRVMDDKCQKVIFFEDPFTARPHEPDIQLLERTCQIYGKSVVCFSDPTSADLWAEAWKETNNDYRNAAPVTLSFALEKYVSKLAGHPIQVILSNSGHDEKETVKNICQNATQYLIELVAKKSLEKNELMDDLRWVIPWGTVMAQLVGELKKSIAARKGFKKINNFIALPMIGLMNSAIPNREASRLAEDLKEIFGGTHYPISMSSFVSKKARLGHQVKEVFQQFDKANIVLLHGKPILLPGQYFGTVTRARTDPDMIQDVYKKGAICEISGLFLDETGKEVIPSKYQRVGMGYQSLRYAGQNEDCHSIFLIGTPDRDIHNYIKMAKAFLKAGFPSLLITDVTFARHLLGL